MQNQNHLRKILLENFTIMKGRNPAFSLRSYAMKLGVSPASLSEIMNGKRNITAKTANKVFERLNISPVEKEKLHKVSQGKKTIKEKDPKYLLLEMDHYHIISEWFYFAILSLAETESFQDRPEWIAERLNIRISEARTALERLERLELLKRDDSGNLVATGASFKTTSDIASGAVRRSHLENLELAKTSLEKDDVAVRDFSSMTMAIDPDLLPEAKKMITDFRRKLTQFLESQSKQEVYKINIQLFPLTNEASKK